MQSGELACDTGGAAGDGLTEARCRDNLLVENDRHRAEKAIQKLTDDFVKKIDETSAAKEEEILQV